MNTAPEGHLIQKSYDLLQEQRPCEDCEETAAEIYCGDCPCGLALCQPCSAVLHAGATRRRHTLQGWYLSYDNIGSR